MSELEQSVWNALRNVRDPCSIACNVPMDVVEMGLVRDVSIDSEGVCHVTLVLTSITCFQYPIIEKGIEEAILSAQLAENVTVKINHDDLWSPGMMEERARTRINAIRQRSQVATGATRRQWQRKIEPEPTD